MSYDSAAMCYEAIICPRCSSVSLAGCRITRYHTDNWQSYAKFLPARRHRTGKEGMSRIERHNLNFRTRLKRLQRHTICYSKSAVMHDAVIKLYLHHSNAGNHHF
jgi:insertion element IS1 protein InsB